jgi:hypothetical protein
VSKRGGTWARLDESLHAHPKTLALAAELAPLMGEGGDLWAADVVVAQLHRLLCWCSRESDSGRIGHLTARKFASILEWPCPRSETLLLSAWHQSGFVDWGGLGRARVHDFELYAHPLLADRRRKRASRVRGQSADLQEAGNRKQETGKKKEVAPPAATPLVAEVFGHWVEVTGRNGRTKLTTMRRKAVAARLKEGYTVDDLRQAIDGCARSPFHQGQNDRQTKYDDLVLICRDGERVEQFQRIATGEARGLVSKQDSNAMRLVEALTEGGENGAAIEGGGAGVGLSHVAGAGAGEAAVTADPFRRGQAGAGSGGGDSA